MIKKLQKILNMMNSKNWPQITCMVERGENRKRKKKKENFTKNINHIFGLDLRGFIRMLKDITLCEGR